MGGSIMASLIPSGSASGTGSMTLAAPVTNSNQTATLPDASGTVMVSGNQPAFYSYPTSTQSITSGVETKVLFDTELFDTNNNFASSRFTPTVAGYYQINYGIRYAGTVIAYAYSYIAKNGTYYSINNQNYFTGTNTYLINGCNLVYCNGSTDYIEIYLAVSATSPSVNYSSATNSSYFSGVLVRSA